MKEENGSKKLMITVLLGFLGLSIPIITTLAALVRAGDVELVKTAIQENKETRAIAEENKTAIAVMDKRLETIEGNQNEIKQAIKSGQEVNLEILQELRKLNHRNLRSEVNR